MVSRFKAFVIGGISLTFVALLLFTVFSGANDSWYTNKERYIFDRQFRADSDVYPFSSIAWSADGKWIATANDSGTIRMYDAMSWSVKYLYKDKEAIKAMAWSPHNDMLLWGCGDEINIWGVLHAASPVDFCILENVSAVAWSPDGNRIAAWGYSYWNPPDAFQTLVNGTLIVYSIENGSATFKLSKASLLSTSFFVDWSPDGNEIISWYYDKMTILDATTGQEIKSVFGHQGWAPSALSPDGKWLAFTGGASWFIEFQNIENMSFSGKCLVPMSYSDRYSSYHSELPSYGSWSHDGQRFAVYDGYSLQVYDTTNIDGLDHVSIISIECSNTIYPIVIWSPDDRRILVTTNYGGMEILALDSDADGIPDYKDVFPTVNENFIIFSNLVAVAVILWMTVLLSHRPRRTKAS